jgi:hypothetical protein
LLPAASTRAGRAMSVGMFPIPPKGHLTKLGLPVVA